MYIKNCHAAPKKKNRSKEELSKFDAFELDMETTTFGVDQDMIESLLEGNAGESAVRMNEVAHLPQPLDSAARAARFEPSPRRGGGGRRRRRRRRRRAAARGAAVLRHAFAVSARTRIFSSGEGSGGRAGGVFPNVTISVGPAAARAGFPKRPPACFTAPGRESGGGEAAMVVALRPC